MASQVVVTVTGNVQSGTDGNPNSTPPGAGRVFGGSGSLDGQSFILTLNFDTTQGTSSFGSCPDGSIYESNNAALDVTTGPTAVLQIGDGSFSYGMLPLSSISWSIARAAPATCTSPYSLIGFGWSENYSGDLGGSGFGSINIYPSTPLPSGDWRAAVPSTAVNATFQFNISFSQNGNLVKYAYGYLTATAIEVSSPATGSCLASTRIVDQIPGLLGAAAGSGERSNLSNDTGPVRTCTGTARVLQGNATLIGRSGGFSAPSVGDICVTSKGAAIIPSQWASSRAVLRPYLTQISGTLPLLNVSFQGISDIIGGAPPAGFPPGSNVQTDLMTLYPGTLILELPGASQDYGTTTVMLVIPASLNCPTGTTEVPQ